MKNLLRIFWQRILELWRGSLGDRLSVIQAIFAVVLTVTSLALHYYREYQDAYLKETTLTFEKQIETLDGVQKSLKYLTAFVIEQRRKLQESQATLSSLKTEQDKLKPLIEADRQIVEAIFELHAAKNRATVWTERIIAFLLGIASSFLASFIWSLVQRKGKEDL